MKNILHPYLYMLPLLLFAAPSNCFSQQKISDFAVRISRPEETYLATDVHGNTACIFQSNKQYEVDFLNSEFKWVGTAVAEKIKADKNQKIIGAILDDNYCNVYFFSKRLRSLSCFQVKKADGETKYTKINALKPDDQFLRAFEMDGKFFFLVVPKLSHSVKVLVLDGPNLQEMNFDIPDMASFYTDLTRNNNLLNVEAESEVGIEEIKYELENNVKSTYPPKKLYHADGIIYLTFDEPQLTHLITLNTHTQKAEHKRLNFSLEKGNNSPDKQGNSYVYKNRFFRVTASPEQMNITILDIDSMSLVNNYNFFPNQDIAIVNGPMLQEAGSGNYITDERIIKKTDQFFRKVLDGNLAIAANPVDDQKYEMQVGSYEIYTTYRGGGGPNMMGGPSISLGMGMGMGGIGIGPGMGPGMAGWGYPYGGMYSPGYGFPGYYSPTPTTRLRMVYFKSLLKNPDFSHVEGNVPVTVIEKINDYEANVFKYAVPEVMRISPYKNNNSVILGYYNKNGKKFSLVEFRK